MAPGRVPASISASGYNALMACPYQFHARYLLKLREADEVQEELEKSDYGMRVHEILTRFHRQHPRLLDLSEEAAQQALLEISEAVFQDDVTRDYVAKAWLARWRNVLPGYVAWQREREGQGWRFLAGEAERSVTLVTPQGLSIVLKGRIDRIDTTADSRVALLDYKTRSRAKLAAELECPGEDVQLPVYALLWSEPVAQALYVPVDAEHVQPVPLEQDVAQHAADVGKRLGALLDRMAQGVPLPAHGIASVCEYCEMGGLCRRKHWS
jgi:ATP-dependent helicase/nuclease subunit B